MTEAEPSGADIYRQAWETYGQDAQLRMLAEECSELAVAALHVVRGRKDAGGPCSNLAEELADVTNMIEQVVTQLGIGEEVSRLRVMKLLRLSRRLEEQAGAANRAGADGEAEQETGVLVGIGGQAGTCRRGTADRPAELLKTPAEILEYLDLAIRLWRRRRDVGDSKAAAYVDAFQAVRISLFGQGLPVVR